MQFDAQGRSTNTIIKTSQNRLLLNFYHSRLGFQEVLRWLRSNFVPHSASDSAWKRPAFVRQVPKHDFISKIRSSQFQKLVKQGNNSLQKHIMTRMSSCSYGWARGHTVESNATRECRNISFKFGGAVTQEVASFGICTKAIYSTDSLCTFRIEFEV